MTSPAESTSSATISDGFVDAIDFTGKVVFVAGGTGGINLGIAEDFARAGARVAVMSRSRTRSMPQSPGCVSSAPKRSVPVPMCATTSRGGGVSRGPRPVRRHRRADFWSRGQLPGGRVGVLIQWVQVGRRHRPAGLVQRGQGCLPVLEEARCVGYQHLRAAGAAALDYPGARVCGQGRCRHADQGAGVGVGPGRSPGERGYSWRNRRHRGDVPIGTHRTGPRPHHRQCAVRRLGTPRDVAIVVRFLASPLASYVSGVVLAADGGWSLGGAASAISAIGQPLLDAVGGRETRSQPRAPVTDASRAVPHRLPSPSRPECPVLNCVVGQHDCAPAERGYLANAFAA